MALEREIEQFEHDGFVILPSLLSRAEIDELVAALAPYERARPMGRNNFEGERSQRVYSLAGKGEVFMRLACNDTIFAFVERVLSPNPLLSTMQSIRLHPGESHQPWHSDDGFYDIPRPRNPRLGVSVIWAIEPFTETNGATEVIPGSHRWNREVPEDPPRGMRAAVMPAGSALVFDAALWHRGGANRSDGTRLCISPQYCLPWLRTQESQLLIAPPDVARGYSDRARAMLGYSIHLPFLGQVDGMHPLRTIDPEYRTRKTRDRANADATLGRGDSHTLEPTIALPKRGDGG